MMDDVNFLLRDLASQFREDATELAYEEYLDFVYAQYDAQMYAARSYDLDAIAYGQF